MGFDVYGPTRHVRASNVDDGDEPAFDILAMPGEYGLHCPQLERLHQRFYDSTILESADGSVAALRDELLRLREAYRERRDPELVRERHIRARDPQIRSEILHRLVQEDIVYRVLDDFRLLCEDAIAAGAVVRCEGD